MSLTPHQAGSRCQPARCRSTSSAWSSSAGRPCTGIGVPSAPLTWAGMTGSRLGAIARGLHLLAEDPIHKFGAARQGGHDLMPVDQFGRSSDTNVRRNSRGTRVLPSPAWFSRWPGSRWLLVSACARDRSWRGWLCHQVHVDDLKPKADDPLYKPGECGLVGQLGAEGGHLRACGDLAVVKLRAQRSAGLAAESDLIRV